MQFSIKVPYLIFDLSAACGLSYQVSMASVPAGPIAAPREIYDLTSESAAQMASLHAGHIAAPREIFDLTSESTAQGLSSASEQRLVSLACQHSRLDSEQGARQCVDLTNAVVASPAAKPRKARSISRHVHTRSPLTGSTSAAAAAAAAVTSSVQSHTALPPRQSAPRVPVPRAWFAA